MFISVTFKSVSQALAATLLLGLLAAPAAQAQRKSKPVNADGSLTATAPAGAVEAREPMRFINTNFQGGSISMRSMVWG